MRGSILVFAWGLFAVVFITAATGCDFDGSKAAARELESQRERTWNGPCKDTATLLATTSGSPSYETCQNKHHRMRVQVASGASHEEFGAVVFCECERDAGVPASPPADAGAK